MFGQTRDSFAEQFPSKEINLKEYTLAQERFDERFGLIFFMKSKSSARTLFVKERSAALPPDQINEINSRLRITDNYLLDIYGMKQVPDSGIFQIYFEEFSTDLQTEIKRHLAEKTRFSEAELYAMLYSAVSALAVLEQNNISHNFIVPMNILKFDKDLYKLHDNFTINNKSYLYNHALRGQYLRYIAPELLESLTRQKEKPDHHDPYKADIFALGMCLLDAGLLNTEGNFINKKLMIIDEKSLQQAIKKFGDLYSTAMMQILQDMLFPDPSVRPSPLVLYKRLPGKPLQKNQAGGRKRKLLDQIINSSSPSKYDMTRNESRLSYASPYRFSADEIQARTSFTGTGGFKEHSYLEQQSESLKRASPHQYAMTHESQYAPNPETDISKVNVSSSIKNDPLLSEFVKKLVNPAYNIRGSPIKTEQERSTFMNIPSASIPTPGEGQLRNFSPSLTPIQPYGYKTETYSKEIETRSFHTADPHSVTQKQSYPQAYTIPDQGRTIADSYRSNLSYTPSIDSYGRVPVTQGRTLGYLQGVDFPPNHIPEQVSNRDSNRDSRPISKMDDIISKALERSSANLYLSQQVSTGIGHGQSTHQEDSQGSYKEEATSFGNQSQKLQGLTTIYERMHSEDFTTPGGSNVIDAIQNGAQKKILRDGSIELQQNLMDVVNSGQETA